MPKQVPEEKKRLSEEEQLAKLREELAGNKAFGRQRGWWSKSLSEKFMEMIETTGSPTQAIKRFDAFAADARVMVQKLARYKRDGEDAGFEMLKLVLTIRGNLIPGEVFPIEKTHPITLVLFNPERTFFLLEATKSSKWDAPYWVRMGHKSAKTLNEAAAFTPLFPHWREDADTAGSDLAVSMLSKILWSELKRQLHFDNEVITRGRYEIWPEPIVKNGVTFDFGEHWLWFGFQDATFRVNYLPVGAWYEGYPADFLRLFSREEQKLIRTWTFDCPPFLEPSRFGFYPEKDHPRWQKAEPSIMSRGVSEGMGAAMLLNCPVAADYYCDENVRMILSELVRLK